jgi:hypothetical protein
MSLRAEKQTRISESAGGAFPTMEIHLAGLEKAEQLHFPNIMQLVRGCH